MSTSSPSLDLARLEKVRRSGDKVIARCPACAEVNADHKGNHLTILSSGKFGCAAMPGDSEHRRRVFALVGIVGERERVPVADSLWREKRATEQRRGKERQHLTEIIQEKRAKIIVRHPWAPADVWENSPQRIDCDLVEFDPRHFLSSLFQQDAIVWSGEVFHSGTRHADRWRSVADWQDAPLAKIGPMTTPSVWTPGTVNRKVENVLVAPYVVLDFDGFDGHKPVTSVEIEKHRHDSLAIIRWICTGLRWQLAAIVWTGSKSMHAWFHRPPQAALESLRDNASPLGVDVGLVGRPEHPCRLPGQCHEKNRGMSRVLWLQEPVA